MNFADFDNEFAVGVDVDELSKALVSGFIYLSSAIMSFVYCAIVEFRYLFTARICTAPLQGELLRGTSKLSMTK